MRKSGILVSVLALLLSACFSQHTSQIRADTTDRLNLQALQNHPKSAANKRDTLSPLRAKMLKETALALAAQGSLAATSRDMNAQMEQDRKYLDTIFNFSAMMLSHGVLPPVLEEGDFTLNLEDPNTIRVADRSFKIVQPARFATTPPNWREYLTSHYSDPELPDRSLLPRNSEESRIWKEAIDQGWDKGIEQAHAIFQQNLARLKRDFRGMALYRKLLQQRMISAPFVARTELGITGDGSDMRINDQVLRIVEPSKLQTSGQNWKAVIAKHDT